MEALFSELKNLVGLRRLRLRRIKFVREQFYLAAVAQNLKRLVRFLAARPQLVAGLQLTTEPKNRDTRVSVKANEPLCIPVSIDFFNSNAWLLKKYLS